MNWYPIQGWQDVSAIFTIASVPLIVGSLFAAFGQIKAQAEISRRELSFNGLIAFNEKFERASDLAQSARERVENHDTTVNQRTVKRVFNSYWRLVHEEWEFFKDGLIPTDIFIGWMVLSYSQIAGETDLPYFNKDGALMEMSSRERFENVVINGRYQHHPAFCAFFTGLYRLRGKTTKDITIPREERYALISKYVREYVREKRIRPIS